MTREILVVDGGGSGTRAGLWHAGSLVSEVAHEGPSCNPHSVGFTTALRNIGELLAEVWRKRPAETGSVGAVWLSLSSASSADALAEFAAALLTDASAPLRDADEVWFANDIAPLLVHDGRVAERVVAICGTGTGFCGINPERRITARASGKEYLLADEGGGFDIGLLGLRAVVRAADGRSPRTRLTDLVPPWRGVSADDLFDLVYGSAEQKVLIASFAAFVLAAAHEGDEPARAIVRHAVDELLAGITAVAERSALRDRRFEVLLAGSNLVGASPVLRDELQLRLGEVLPAVEVRLAGGSALPAVARLAELLPVEPRLQDALDGCVPFARFTPDRASA